MAYNSAGSPIFYTATYGLGSTCHLLVSSANGGYFAVLDPNNNVVYIRWGWHAGSWVALIARFPS